MPRLPLVGGFPARPHLLCTPLAIRATVPLAALVCAVGAVTPAVAAPEPVVERQVLEDDNVRIEELRVRGVNRRLVVRPKSAGGVEYEIIPEAPAQDASQDKRSAGRRVWRLFSF